MMKYLTNAKKKNPLVKHLFWIVIIAIVWELLTRSGVINAYIIPPISVVINTLINGIINGKLLLITWNSIVLIMQGYFFSVCLSLLVTFLCVRFLIIKSLVNTLSVLLTPLPGIAVLPVIIMMFGVGKASIILLILHGVLWPMVINLIQGLDTVPVVYLEYAYVLGLKKYQVFKSILIPAIISNLIAGLRIAWSRSWRALISAEMIFGAIGGLGGIGYYIFTNRAYGNMAEVMSGVIIIMIIGVVMESVLFSFIEKKTLRKWGIKNELS